MECDICMLEWDSKKIIPRLLSCGHTFCEVCLLSLLNTSIKNKSDFFCPNCMTKQKEIKKENDIKLLIKNFNLLRIVEKIESRKSVVTNQSFFATEKSINDLSQQIKNLEIDQGEALQIAYDQKCKKHNLPVHSYAIGTNLLFCDKCIQDTNLKTYPLPNVTKDLKRKLDSNCIKVCLIKNEIERLKDFFYSYQKEFEKTNKAKIEDLFNYLYKIISYNLNSAMHILNQCKAEQKSNFDEKLKELLNLENELNEMESDMSKINISDDRELIKHNDKINKIALKIENFINYDLELNLISMKIGIKEDMKNVLFQNIQDSYFVDVDFMEVNDECPTIKHILQKEKYWSCICGELNNQNSEVRCTFCSNFRRHETLGSIFTDLVSNEEIKIFNQIKKEESKEFQENLKLTNMTSYYAVDLEWFLQWKCYVTNDTTEKQLPNSKKRISQNKLIGVLPPGPIINTNLFEKNAKEFTDKTFKKGLKKNEDYVVVNEKIWKMFLHNFNGGPEIQLSKNDEIYTSFQSVSVKEYFSYSVIKELLAQCNASVHSSMFLGVSHDLELSVIPDEREIGTVIPNIKNINKDNKNFLNK